jgi:hypothetical protein
MTARKRQRVEQITFSKWCRVGAAHGLKDLDPAIVDFLLRLMAAPEAEAVDGLGLWQKWVQRNKTTLRWTEPHEWTRVELTARLLWKAFAEYKRRVE